MMPHGRTSTLNRQIRLSLPVAILLAVLPQLLILDPMVSLLALLLFIWQVYLAASDRPNPGRLIQLVILLGSFAILVKAYGHIIGQQAGIALLLLMCLLKLFETRNARDATIIVFSSFFLLASNFFQSQSIWLMLYVFLAISGLYAILIALSDRCHSLSSLQLLRLSLRFNVYALPFMLVLFVLFPRIPGPLWGLPEDAFTARTGLSDEMSPGSINQLVSSGATAFRVKFHGEVPPQRQRYWRALVLTRYDGTTWRRDDAPARARPNITYPKTDTRGYDYTLTLEATGKRWLPSLETTRSLPSTAEARALRLTREAVIYRDRAINQVSAFRLQSQTDAVNHGLFAYESYKNRMLPGGKNPQTLALAKQLLEAAGYRGRDYINAVLAYFQQQGFVYTLSPPSLGEHAMDDFLFRSRQGFCEHYASAFTYLMRAAGIPARVVIGYQGGRMNPLDEHMVIRQSDAHAWAEIWYGDDMDGYWRRIDPTAVVSPERIANGIGNAGLDVEKLPLLLVSDSNLLQNMAWLYDSLQQSWNRWVLGFDRNAQMNLLQALGLQGRLGDLILLLTVLMSLAALLTAWLLLRQRNRQDPVTDAYHLLCRKLNKRGIEKLSHEGPADFEQRIRQQLPLPAEDLGRLRFLFNAYRQLHYGNIHNPQLQKLFIRRVKKF